MIAQFLNPENTFIQVTDDNGVVTFVPVVGANKDYRKLLESKIEIQPYVEPELPLEIQREREYEKCGCTIAALTIALWESLIEDRPEAAQELQAKRVAVKEMYPKL